jgi:ATP-dependent Lon protease
MNDHLDDLPPASDDKNQQDKSIVVVSDLCPTNLPILPLRDRPIFPHILAPIIVSGEKQIKLIEDLVNTSPYCGLVLYKKYPEVENKFQFDLDGFHRVGVSAKIVQVRPSNTGDSIHVFLKTLERFEIVEFTRPEEIFRAQVRYWYEDRSPRDEESRAYHASIIGSIRELIRLNPLFKEELTLLLGPKNTDDPALMADLAASLTTATGEELQEILGTKILFERLEKVLILLKKEIEITQVQATINKRINEQVSKQQKEFFLKQQLKEIKKELGMSKDDKEAEVDRFTNRLKDLQLTAEATERINEELEKLKLLEWSSPEYHVTRNYLDWLTLLPWGQFSPDNYDLVKAKEILEADHYGLQDVKERILEFISVGKIRGRLKGNIILLVGPPGVGKTSVGQSVARALGRNFYRFSVGGMRDEAEIKGHRRTYIGAMPGKLIQAIKSVKFANPVILLDEIDKIGTSYQGDPASALLEVLDPEQNKDFLDHYLDVRFDLSEILFICTANQLETIPSALLDRMEIIKLSGYILEEKIHIANRHLIPKQLEQHGLSSDQVQIPEDTLREIIDGHAREAGVRGLEKNIKKILRKSAAHIVQGQQTPIIVGQGDLTSYLGKKVFKDEQYYQSPMIGVVTGLAYTSLGGSTIFIEANKMSSTAPSFKQTGQLGSVMVESSEIAFNYIRAFLSADQGAQDFFKNYSVHLHVPAGATPKDGPSAGVTMASALYSLVKNIPIQENMAMTGELTLTGLVMPIGGVKEKTLAAKRSGITSLIFPAANKEDFEELDPSIKQGINPYFVSNFQQVLDVCFLSSN